MKNNKLGVSNIWVSEVGFGCMSLSKENSNLIHQAIDNGINYFDTADLYDFGENEKLIGSALKGKRNKVTLATKVGNRWNADKSGWTWDVSKTYINQAINNSLTRLQTDYIDLYQIHGGTIEDNFDEVLETLESLVDLGKIKSYGISSIRPNVFLKYAQHSNMVSNMMQYSLLDTRPEPYLPIIEQNNVSVLARGAFAQGILLGKSIKPYLNYTEDQVHRIVSQVERLAKENSMSRETVALAYLLKYKKITSAVVGISNEEQLRKLMLAIEEIQHCNIDFDVEDLPKNFYQDHLS